MSRKQILVIIEGSGKINKLQSIFNKANKDDAIYKVVASNGHVRDLGKRGLSIDIEHDFQPKYDIMEGKLETVRRLKQFVNESTRVILATDDDREGEAIAWHLLEILNLGHDFVQYQRIKFNSITESDVLHALRNPIPVDMAMVNAYQLRRIWDRIVGYETTKTLWKHIKSSTTLSAGRVQSIPLKIIKTRETEIDSKDIKYFFTYVGNFKIHDKFNATMIEKKSKNIVKIDNEKDAVEILQKFMEVTHCIDNIIDSKSVRKPPLPFITSTLQIEASKKLGFNVKKTMEVAQKLYEKGFITYMRTDSTMLSKEFIQKANSWIESKYGSEYCNYNYVGKNKKGAQEAHEAIRPTNVENISVSGTNEQNRLYALIWNRTVASLMTPMLVDVTTVQIGNKDKTLPYYFEKKFEKVSFWGFRILEKPSNDTEKIELQIGMDVQRNQITTSQEYSKVPSRYNEPLLIKKLEELNIGRPSTYASMVTKILERNYVEVRDIKGMEVDSIQYILKKRIVKKIKKIKLGNEKQRMILTNLGKIVCEHLDNNLPIIMNYDFTAKMESNLDKVAKDKVKWQDVIKTFYQEFHPLVVKSLQEKVTVKHNADEIVIGNVDGKISIVKTRYGGAFCWTFEDKNRKPKFASIDKTLMKKINKTDDKSELLDTALGMLKYPLALGVYQNKPVELCNGKYGLYLRWNSQNYSVKRDMDLNDAIMRIESA